MNMELSSERKLQLWDEAARVNEAQTEAEGRQWRKRYLLYVGMIAAAVAIATVAARLAS